LVGQLKILHWSALFVDNVVRVLLLSVVVSWASRHFDWWLRPAGRDPKREIAGVALVLSFYALFPSRVLAIRIARLETMVIRPTAM
jgi:hypothetical protein